jgi:UPF0271 protein
VLASPEAAAGQALSIVRDGCVASHDGQVVAVRADTICIHGDTPAAATIAEAIRATLESAGVKIAALGS